MIKIFHTLELVFFLISVNFQPTFYISCAHLAFFRSAPLPPKQDENGGGFYGDDGTQGLNVIPLKTEVRYQSPQFPLGLSDKRKKWCWMKPLKSFYGDHQMIHPTIGRRNKGYSPWKEPNMLAPMWTLRTYFLYEPHPPIS